MKKIYEHADQQHVGLTIVYGSQGKLYANAAHTEYLDLEEVYDAFVKGSLAFYETTGVDSYVVGRIIGYSIDEGKTDLKDYTYLTADSGNSFKVALDPNAED